jgi:hypothetical protein
MRPPKTSDLKNLIKEKVFSGYDPQPIGYADELATEVLYTDQDKRLNFHILGAPGQGKSKFIELLAAWNIGREPICLIDSTEGGKTASNLLKHCYLRNYQNVVIIDPTDFAKYNAVPIIKPLKLNQPSDVSINNIMDILRVLWDAKFEETRRLERYIPAVLKALWEAKLTLAELDYLLYQYFVAERDWILSKFSNPKDPKKMTLLSAYRDVQYNNHFLPSVNTLTPLTSDLFKSLLGSSKKGLPWSRFIKERWVIIVNLNPRGALGDDIKSRKLLGTIIISEIIHALARMVARGWQAPFSMYIDEVGHYVTPKLANILNHQRHLNLRLTLAHQEFHQIKNDEVLHAILTSAQNKCLFYTSNHADRLLMMQTMGYGGDIPDRMVLYNLAQLEKQKVAIRLGKDHPVYMRVRNISDPEVSKEDLHAYKQAIYKAAWYASPDDINSEIHARFPEEQFAPPSISKRKPHTQRAAGAAANAKKQSPPKSHRRPAAPPVSDDSPDSPPVLQPPERRPAVKIPWD